MKKESWESPGPLWGQGVSQEVRTWGVLRGENAIYTWGSHQFASESMISWCVYCILAAQKSLSSHLWSPDCNIIMCILHVGSEIDDLLVCILHFHPTEPPKVTRGTFWNSKNENAKYSWGSHRSGSKCGIYTREYANPENMFFLKSVRLARSSW